MSLLPSCLEQKRRDSDGRTAFFIRRESSLFLSTTGEKKRRGGTGNPFPAIRSLASSKVDRSPTDSAREKPVDRRAIVCLLPASSTNQMQWREVFLLASASSHASTCPNRKIFWTTSSRTCEDEVAGLSVPSLSISNPRHLAPRGRMTVSDCAYAGKRLTDDRSSLLQLTPWKKLYTTGNLTKNKTRERSPAPGIRTGWTSAATPAQLLTSPGLHKQEKVLNDS